VIIGDESGDTHVANVAVVGERAGERLDDETNLDRALEVVRGSSMRDGTGTDGAERQEWPDRERDRSDTALACRKQAAPCPGRALVR
jgi:hypothetical protein